MTVCYLGIGSNQGKREKNIEAAISHLKRDKDIEFKKASRLYETEAVGGPTQGKFLNAAIELDCRLSPEELLRRLKDIELKLGRAESLQRWGPRVIDLDILLYGDLVLREENLKIPHPLMHQRFFALKPLADIAPQAYHPIRKKTIAQLLREIEGR